MKAAPVKEIKKALLDCDHDELLQACLRLARFKADNKELLTYLLMKSTDEQSYIDEVCTEMDELLPETRSIHKKTMRKIIRWFEKRIRYSANKETELQIRIHFCGEFVRRRIRFGRCRVSTNMYLGQLKKIEKAMEKVHPDLQFDFRHQMQDFESVLR